MEENNSEIKESQNLDSHGGEDEVSKENPELSKKAAAEESKSGIENASNVYGCSYLKVMVASIRAKAIVWEAKAKGLRYKDVSLVKPKSVKPTFIALEEIEAGFVYHRKKKGSSISDLRKEAEKRQRNSEL